MATTTDARLQTPPQRKSLRLLPGIVAAGVALLLRGVALVAPDATLLGMAVPMLALLAGVVCALAIVLWWLFFSRAAWRERLLAIGLMAAAVIAVRPLLHDSIAGAGMGNLFFIGAIQTMAIALVVWAVATRRASGVLSRSATLAAAILVGAAGWTLVRTGGITGEGTSEFHWRWTPTAEERLLAQAEPPPPAPVIPAPDSKAEAPAAGTRETSPPVTATPPATATPPPAARPPARAGWPGFRGSRRDGVIRGVRVATDWTASAPVELWRQPVGPGWSSFAVEGDFIYTQEQRGEYEMVSCYRLSDGRPVWQHRDAARFYESNGGPGPRATPALHDGRVYTLGATGIVNALDARTGAVVWSRNAQADTGAPLPGWGFAGSPLVADGLVIVATSGRLAAYELATGTLRWTRATGGGGYSSPHLMTIGGLRQVLLASGGGITSVLPADGAVLWQDQGTDGVNILQPAAAGNGDILLASGDMMGGTGIRRISVSNRSGAWTVEERWSTRGLKPYFNDFVVHEGHAYGFDGTILSCIDLATGERKWKGGRYGAGQMMLLADQDLLLVLSEEGELALVSATPEKHAEAARFKAIEGKTWNHPVLLNDMLLVRNGEEMAAFRLPLVNR